jgi:site-specific recombinase XerC
LHEEILSSFDKETPSQSDLDKRIFDNESSQEAENNLRAVLKDLKALKEIKEGAALGRINKAKTSLEQICESTFIIPEKSEKEYASKLSVLGSYFEALLSGAKIETNPDDVNEKIQAETERQQQVW